MIPKIATVLLTAVLALVSARPLWAQDPTTTDGLKPGDVLNETNWQMAQGLLPPEILRHYRSDEYANPIVDWPREKYEWPPDFAAATEKNAGQFDIDDAGTIVVKGSGKQPPYILGLPFPFINRADPRAGTKILWNNYYARWYVASVHAESQLCYLGHVLMENRHGLVVETEVTEATGTGERTAGAAMLVRRGKRGVFQQPANYSIV